MPHGLVSPYLETVGTLPNLRLTNWQKNSTSGLQVTKYTYWSGTVPHGLLVSSYLETRYTTKFTVN